MEEAQAQQRGQQQAGPKAVTHDREASTDVSSSNRSNRTHSLVEAGPGEAEPGLMLPPSSVPVLRPPSGRQDEGEQGEGQPANAQVEGFPANGKGDVSATGQGEGPKSAKENGAGQKEGQPAQAERQVQPAKQNGKGQPEGQQAKATERQPAKLNAGGQPAKQTGEGQAKTTEAQPAKANVQGRLAKPNAEGQPANPTEGQSAKPNTETRRLMAPLTGIRVSAGQTVITATPQKNSLNFSTRSTKRPRGEDSPVSLHDATPRSTSRNFPSPARPTNKSNSFSPTPELFFAAAKPSANALPDSLNNKGAGDFPAKQSANASLRVVASRMSDSKPSDTPDESLAL